MIHIHYLCTAVILCCSNYSYTKCQTQSKRQTHRQTCLCPSIHPFVRLFVRCVCQGGGERKAMFHRNLGGENPDQPKNTPNLVSRLSGKTLKLLPTDVTF